MKKIYDWVVDKRLLDGYIGIMGAVLFYKLLADYRGIVYLIEVSAKAGKHSLFHISLAHWRQTRIGKNAMPLIRLQASIWTWHIDTAAKEVEELHARAAVSMADYKRREQEKERLYETAVANGAIDGA